MAANRRHHQLRRAAWVGLALVCAVIAGEWVPAFADSARAHQQARGALEEALHGDETALLPTVGAGTRPRVAPKPGEGRGLGGEAGAAHRQATFAAAGVAWRWTDRTRSVADRPTVATCPSQGPPA